MPWITCLRLICMVTFDKMFDRIFDIGIPFDFPFGCAKIFENPKAASSVRLH